MNNMILKKNSEAIRIWGLILSAVLFTMFLFYIDEGNYNFSWIRERFVWIIFMIYAIPIFVSQLLFYKVILKKASAFSKISLSMILGALTGTILTIGMLTSFTFTS